MQNERFFCDWCPYAGPGIANMPEFPTAAALRQHIIDVHRLGQVKPEDFCDEYYCPGNCAEFSECPGECC